MKTVNKMNMLSLIISCLLFLVHHSAAYAVQPDELLPDAQMEARARTISSELRCMVCQNQSIDDSDAPLARDLRVLVREHVREGKTDKQITDYLVARYGDFILLRPPLKAQTIVLWATPAIILMFGALFIYRHTRTRGRQAVQTLSVQEQAHLDELIAKENRHDPRF